MDFIRIKKIKNDGTLENKKNIYFEALIANGVPQDKFNVQKEDINRIVKLDLDNLSKIDTKTLRDFEFFLKLGLNIFPNVED